MTLYDQLKADLPAAMKARDKDKVTALRAVIAAIDNAEAVEVDTSIVPLVGRTADVPRRELSEAEVRALLQKEIDERQAAADNYDRLGYSAAANPLRAEAAVITQYVGASHDDL